VEDFRPQYDENRAVSDPIRPKKYRSSCGFVVVRRQGFEPRTR
jgi:hypothetical protein